VLHDFIQSGERREGAFAGFTTQFVKVSGAFPRLGAIFSIATYELDSASLEDT
jgi:Na+/melibiose symporter-like transporter